MFPKVVPLVTILVVLTPRSAAAQAAAAPPALRRAAELIAKAEHSRARPAERVALLEEAAALLPSSDPRASSSLRAAARSLYQLHKYKDALQVLEFAAYLADQRGSLHEAIETYLEAVDIAVEINARGEAGRYLDRALAVTTSSALPEAERQRIRRRIESIMRVRATEEVAAVVPEALSLFHSNS